MRGCGDGEDDVGQHLLLSSLHENRPKNEEAKEDLQSSNLMRGMNSQAEYFKGDLAE